MPLLAHHPQEILNLAVNLSGVRHRPRNLLSEQLAIEAPQPVLGANNIPLFRVRMGTLKGNLALQVTKKIERPK